MMPTTNDEIVLAPAKINLFLDVKAKRPDGYHEIETLMQAVDLCDELIFRRTRSPGIGLFCNGEGLPPAEENLVVRAADLLRSRFRKDVSVSIELRKNIPPGAGLGGGSSDAAATLKALSRLWGLDLDSRRLIELAAELGSDVPFFIRGGAARCTGRGELIEPVETERVLDFVIVMPPIGISTAKVYGEVDSLTKESHHVNIERTICGLKRGDPRTLGGSLYNGLRLAAEAVDPRVKEVGALMDEVLSATGPCGYGMSGSGSAWFGVYHSRRQAVEAAGYIGQTAGFPARAVRSVMPALTDDEQPAKES